MKYPLIFCALLAILAATPALAWSIIAEDASTVSIGNLLIENAFTRPTPAGATVAVGYMSITNNGSAPDRLVSVDSNIAAKTEIHESKMENGVMEMHELPAGLEIPAGATVSLKPGGDHVMFMDLKQPVKAGDIVHATLGFENAGKIDIGFRVAPSLGAMAPGDNMGGMKMK
jgi:periplasmic copper chaperone A